MKETDLKLVLNFLHEKRGFDFSGYRLSFVEQRISQRLQALDYSGFPAYQDFLQNSADEMNKLVDLLTINFSQFFRDSLTFEYLGQVILPAVVAKKEKQKLKSLRVWSAGCSNGEEAYSLAIMIKELLQKIDFELNLHIFATDIDEKALTRSKQAVYTAESLGEIKFGWLKKYFTKEGISYKLNPEIKKMVNFSYYNLLEKGHYAPTESIYGSFDITLCRNVLIYFQKESQEEIIEKLHRSLVPQGFLVLGDAEMPSGKYAHDFQRINQYCKIFQKT